MPEFSSEVWIVIVLGAATLSYLGGRATRGTDRKPDADRAAIAARYGALTAAAQVKVDALLGEKKYIEAIKVVRDETDLGLKEAKEAVDWRRRMLGG